jgi:hypothetical protein
MQRAVVKPNRPSRAVDNMFAARGLEIVSQMLRVAGGRYAENATALAAAAARLKASIVSQMWNGFVVTCFENPKEWIRSK